MDALDRGAAQMARIGDVLRLAWNLSMAAHIQLFAGRLAAARQSLHRRAQLVKALSPQAGTAADHVVAMLSRCDSDPQRALADLQALTAMLETRPISDRPAVWLLQAELLIQDSDLVAARLFIDQAFTFILEIALDPPGLWCSAGGPFMLLLFPLAEALSKLEVVTTDPAAFRARCRELRGQYPAFAPEFTHWYLEPAQPDPDFGAGEVWLPHAEMAWTDPLGDCRYIADGEGISLYAANGRDLWQLNRSAPRLLRPVTGDFALECTVAAHDDRPAMGGLLLWQDEENYVRLHWGVRHPDEIGFDGNLDNRDLGFGRGKLPGAGVILRLERRGNRVTALCRVADDPQWYTAGSVNFPPAGPLWAGVHAVGYIDRAVYPAAYPAAYPDGTAVCVLSPHLAR